MIRCPTTQPSCYVVMVLCTSILWHIFQFYLPRPVSSTQTWLKGVHSNSRILVCGEVAVGEVVCPFLSFICCLTSTLTYIDPFLPSVSRPVLCFSGLTSPPSFFLFALLPQFSSLTLHWLINTLPQLTGYIIALLTHTREISNKVYLQCTAANLPQGVGLTACSRSQLGEATPWSGGRKPRLSCMPPLNTFISWVALMISDRCCLFKIARKIPKESNKFFKLTFETIITPASHTLTILRLENTTFLHPSPMFTSSPSFDVAPLIVGTVLFDVCDRGYYNGESAGDARYSNVKY